MSKGTSTKAKKENVFAKKITERIFSALNPLPATLDEWEIFMNGYRDPLTRLARKIEWQKQQNSEGSFSMPSQMGESERECGFRNEGGTYAVCPTSPNGKPVEHFLICNPVPIDKDEYGLQNIGVRLRDVMEPCLACDGKGSQPGYRNPFTIDFNNTVPVQCPKCEGAGKVPVTHIFDIVGREAYPNVSDFIEEARRLGVSRRLELEDKGQYARLSSRSRLILLHERAVLYNPYEVWDKFSITEIGRLSRAQCPKYKEIHALSPFNHEMEGGGQGCAALHWNVIEGGEVIPEFSTELKPEVRRELVDNGRFVKRNLKSGAYRGYSLPQDVKANFALGIFGVFPLGQIHVINSSGEFSNRVERASAAKVDVLETDC